MMKNRLKEWSVPCEWCGAKVGEPCVNNINGPTTQVYEATIHIPRQRFYNQVQALIDGRKPLGPPPKRYTKGQPTR